MARILLAVALLMLAGSPVAAQDPGEEEAPPPEGQVIGLLMVPTLMPPNACAPVTVGTSVPLYATRGAPTPIGEIRVVRGPLEPDARASSCQEGPDVRVTVRGATFGLVTEEHGYEEESLMVTAAEPGWYQIRTGGTPGLLWMRHPPGVVYRPLAELFKDSLTYLNDGWDRRLYTSPYGGFTVIPRLSARNGRFEPAVNVNEVAVVDGVYWARVTFVESCDPYAPMPQGRGWVKVHEPKPTWRPTLWFYSRGC